MLNNDPSPATIDHPRRPRAAALLSTTMLLASAAPLAAALVALTAAPLAAAAPAHAPASARHASAVLNAEGRHHVTVPFAWLGAAKYPLEGGD